MKQRCPKFLLYIAVALIAVGAFAQIQSGNIYGKVQAKDGSVLPGVTVTLSGIGAPQTTLSDAQGNFRFINLSPGTYGLKAELSGYGAASRTGIGVRLGANADVTMTLNPSVSESITVTAEAPLLDVRKAGTAIDVTKVELEKVPTSRDPWTILQQAPGVQVDRINVGGNQSGQQSVYIGKGSTFDQNTWNVDGVAITDMVATGASPTYYNFDSFEEMQVTTGGSDPRIMTPGVQLNMVTKRGTNDFKGGGRYFYTPGSAQADATVPAEAQSYLVTTNRINYVRDYGGEVGGPIWRDHIWAWVAESENKISNQASSSPSSTGLFDNIILRNKNAKINGQILPSNSAVAFYSLGDKVRNARGLAPTRPFETAFHQSGPTHIYKLEDTQIFGSSLYLTGMWSNVPFGFKLIPNGGPDNYAWRDSTTAGGNIWHGSYIYEIFKRPSNQSRLDGSKFFDIGTMNHELKFGFGYRHAPDTSFYTWPGPNEEGFVRYRNASYCSSRGVTIPADGQCMQAFLYRAANGALDQKYQDVFVGDTMLLGNLTVQAGLRWDHQATFNPAATTGANPLIGTPITVPLKGPSGVTTASLPALSYPGDSRKLIWKSISPRIGMTYALGADKKTLLRAGYNRYVNQVGSLISYVSPVGSYSYFQFLGNDANHDHIAQRNELLMIRSFYNVDPANPAALTSVHRVDYGMKPPHTDELIVGGERELMTDFSVGVNLTYRKIHNLVESRAEHTQGKGDFFTRADYVVAGQTSGTYKILDKQGNLLHTITAPIVNYYDLKNQNDVPTFFVYRNRPDYSQRYEGAELTATKRLSHRWMLRGNFAYNNWTEHCGQNAVADPTPLLGNCPGGIVTERSAGSGAFGNVFVQAKWTFNVTGLYQLPWDFNIGGSLVGRQGYARPFREEVSVASGTNEVVLQPVGSLRFPNVFELDLRFAKDFRFYNRYGITLAGDLFNVPNKRTILQRETDLSVSNADYITEMQSPRVWRLSARVNF
jgi:carboxypeptidase family protein/TonB-dependent receptor-like protein